MRKDNSDEMGGEGVTIYMSIRLGFAIFPLGSIRSSTTTDPELDFQCPNYVNCFSFFLLFFSALFFFSFDTFFSSFRFFSCSFVYTWVPVATLFS